MAGQLNLIKKKDVLKSLGRAATIRQMPKSSTVLGTPSTASIPGSGGKSGLVAQATKKLTPAPIG